MEVPTCLITFKHFPSGACGDASIFLAEQGCGTFEYVSETMNQPRYPCAIIIRGMALDLGA